MLARFAGVAIDHARRFTDAAARRDDLARTVAPFEATTEIARAEGGETDLEVILELVAKRGRALVSARVLLIELVNGSELVVAAAYGDGPAEVALDQLGLGAAVEALTERASRHGSRSPARSSSPTSERANRTGAPPVMPGIAVPSRS